ncbi:MAG: SpoIID/LytB domain-containing protein, partial [Gemmatimonadales bacterium]
MINQLGVESYLAGVLSAEMGRRDSSDIEAIKAQAVISRTFALKNRGKRRADGFDLNATVADQVYGGVTTETPLAWWAVRSTTGQVLTWQGGLIDAFFSSTCGGRTAEGTEVYVGADRPYLRSIEDVDPDGQAYCRISPRFRWSEEWTGDSLRDILRRTLPATTGISSAEIARVVDVRVTARTVSDRAGRVEINLGSRVVSVSGPDIRLTLRPAPGQVLRSSGFTLTETRSGGQVERLVADGRGSGHGVGFCQWG